MRKKVAGLLTLIMLVSTLQYSGVILAADKALEVTSTILAETDAGLEEKDRNYISSGGNSSNDADGREARQESALAKWNRNYKLSFFTQVGNDTKKITIDPTKVNDYGDHKKIELQINFGDMIINSDEVSVKVFNNASKWGESYDDKIKLEDVGGEKILRTELALNDPMNIEGTTFNITYDVTVDGNVKSNTMKFKIENDTIYMYTTGIASGHITPFILEDKSGKAIQEELILNGPSNFDIQSIHIDENGDNITYINDPANPNDEQAGGKPGVKISFDKFKKINTVTGKFETFDDPNQLVILGLKANGKNVELNFNMAENSPVEINGEVTTPGQQIIKFKDDKVNLYLTKEASRVAADGVYTIEWSNLTESIIVNNDEFKYAYSYKEGGKDKHVSYDMADKQDASNIGATYLEYEIKKIPDNRLQINIKPYKTNLDATYKIYVIPEKWPVENKGKPQTERTILGGTATESLELDVFIEEGGPKKIIIETTINGKNYMAQWVYYNPNDEATIPRPTYIEKIYNLYVVPSKIEDTQRIIGFDIRWEQPKDLKNILKDGNIYYEMIVREDPEDQDPNIEGVTDSNAFYSKIFEVSAGKDKNGQDIPIVGRVENGVVVDKVEQEYNGVFIYKDLNIKNLDKTGWQQVIFDEEGKYEDDYLNPNNVKIDDNLKEKTIPDTYYVSFKTGFIENGKTDIRYSGESNLVPITLDETEEIVPVPTDINFKDNSNEDKTIISEKIMIDNVDIQKYVDIMLRPVELELYIEDNMGNEILDKVKKDDKYHGYYEVYLYQDKENIADLEKVIPTDKTEFIYADKDGKIDLKTSMYNGKSCIEILNNGGTIPVLIPSTQLIGEGITTIQLDGLNPNEVYYVKTRVQLTPREKENHAEKSQIRYSIFSKEFTFTTTRPPLPPTTEDKKPGAPEKIWIIDQPNNTSVNIGWAPVNMKKDDVTDIHYEFIRTDLAMNKDEEEKTIEELVAIDKNRVGFKSNELDIVDSIYKNNGWSKIDDASAKPFVLKDNNLSPNNLYYYYVRTVCTIDGEIVKSAWISVPVTTEPVSGIINLKVEVPKDYDHDTKRETVISFDAPIPNEGDVPSKYDFDIAIKGELDDKYTLDKYSVTRLSSKEDDSLSPEGYIHFVYKIRDLKPNKRYYIKVRVVDKTKALETGGAYPTSLYSNPVTTRTEFDEDEDDKDNKFEEYLDRYDKEVEKLRRRPYWVVDSNGMYKYRQDYIKTEMNTVPKYKLVSQADQTSLYYYLPASVFVTETSPESVIELTMGKYSLDIRPDTITEATREIEEAIKEVDEKDIEDYYVGVEFRLGQTIPSVGGETSITPEIRLNMEIVYSEEDDRDVEEDIMSELNKLIADRRLEYIDDLEEEVYEGKVSTEILEELITEAIEEIEEDHEEEVYDIMKDVTEDTVEISQISKPMLLTVEVDKSSVNGYYYANTWVNAEVYTAGNKAMLEASRLGSYILTGRLSIAVTNPSLGPYEDFISKYNLTDFFKIDNVSMKQYVNKKQVYGALARVMGAPRGTDYVVYLKNIGIKGVSSIGLSSPIRQDQMIYIIMQGYEKTTHRPIKSIVIRDRLSVNNIGAFQDIYRPYIYAAVELKIINNPNKKVLPSKQMTVEETIKILSKVKK